MDVMHISGIPMQRRQRQENGKSEASLGCTVKACFNKGQDREWVGGGGKE